MKYEVGKSGYHTGAVQRLNNLRNPLEGARVPSQPGAQVQPLVSNQVSPIGLRPFPKPPPEAVQVAAVFRFRTLSLTQVCCGELFPSQGDSV